MRPLLSSLLLLPACAAVPTPPVEPAAPACDEQLAAASAVGAIERDAGEWAANRLEGYNQLAQSLRTAVADQYKLTIAIQSGTMVTEVPNAVLFESGSAKLSAEGQAFLERLVPVLTEESGRRIMLAGHTDDQPVRAGSSTLKSNMDLSAQRSIAAFEFLRSKGIDPARMAASAHGPYAPIADNGTEDGRARNRRLEIIFFPTEDELPQAAGTEDGVVEPSAAPSDVAAPTDVATPSDAAKSADSAADAAASGPATPTTP